MRTRRSGAAKWGRTVVVVLVAACAGIAAAPWQSIAATVDPAQLLTASTTPPPTLSLPSVTLPPVSLPVVELPPVTVLPTVTVPPVTLPSVTLPPLSLPPVTVPSLTSLTLPDLVAPQTTGTPSLPTATAPDPSQVPVSGDGRRLPATSDAREPAETVPRAGSVGRDRPATSSGAQPPTGPLPLRLRKAVSETARQLSFPLGLAAAILAFLVLQPRLDRDDPSVAHTGTSRDDDLLGFS